MQGDTIKFQVYVKNPKGNVVKVNFGQGGGAKGGTMRIRKSNPGARKSFRARHNCDNPGPRHKARYWSCRKWKRYKIGEIKWHLKTFSKMRMSLTKKQ